MQNKFKLTNTVDSDEEKLSKSPIIVGVILVYIATVFMQNIYKVSVNSTIGFTIMMAVHLLVYLFSDRLFKHRHWLYFGVQGIIIFDCAVIMPQGYGAIFLGLIPVLIFQSMVVYYDNIKIVITSIFYYFIFCGTILAFNGVKELINYIPILLLITFAVRAYSAMFLKQVKLRIQSQKVLKELELAYEKVEDLTLTNERQRMARDLHDTLSQGLAGIIMQLEAVNANLNNNNIKRAQEIIQISMEHARKTLSDSRLVIDDLRFKTDGNIDFNEAIDNEVFNFKSISGTSITTNIGIESKIPNNILKHVLYIVREALNNIAKHADAKNAAIDIKEIQDRIYISIKDDGIGFNVKLIDQLFGHYGILGITERVKSIHGEIKIKSKKKHGTNLNIIIPIGKGIYDENE